MDYNINFPHLHIYLEHVGKTISIGSFDIAYYGIIIALAIVVGILLACKEARRTGQNEEDYLDLALFAVVFSVIGARIYYVVFQWDYYKEDLWSILNIRQGGLAIYGAIIGAVITVIVVAKVKKKSYALFMDTACMGLVMGQIIGRWGNFFNREAFGGYTDGLLAMQLPVSAVRINEITQPMWENIQTINGVDFIQVHPTFLYEGLWNLLIFGLLLLYRDRKRFTGELFLLYLGGYALGRFWIEGLRTDQLLIGHTNLAVSQLLSALLVLGCVTLDVIMRRRKEGQL
ncbi:MAG: prolipoprotein diacylglyceryl transferase [Lachnospiraceae bacterium]